MKIIYESFDGKQFEAEEECFKWEAGADLRKLKQQEKFEAFDEDKKSTNNYDIATYFVIKTYTAAQALNDYFSALDKEGYYIEYSNPFEDLIIVPGLYIWNYEMELWENAFKTVHAIMDEVNSLQVFEADFEKEKEN